MKPALPILAGLMIPGMGYLMDASHNHLLILALLAVINAAARMHLEKTCGNTPGTQPHIELVAVHVVCFVCLILTVNVAASAVRGG